MRDACKSSFRSTVPGISMFGVKEDSDLYPMDPCSRWLTSNGRDSSSFTTESQVFVTRRIAQQRAHVIMDTTIVITSKNIINKWWNFKSVVVSHVGRGRSTSHDFGMKWPGALHNLASDPRLHAVKLVELDQFNGSWPVKDGLLIRNLFKSQIWR